MGVGIVAEGEASNDTRMNAAWDHLRVSDKLFSTSDIILLSERFTPNASGFAQNQAGDISGAIIYNPGSEITQTHQEAANYQYQDGHVERKPLIETATQIMSFTPNGEWSIDPND